MPRDEHDHPDGVADAGPEQEPEQAAEPADVRERHEEVAGEEEDGERAADGDHRERDAEVGDQDVLEHVDALQVALADRVDRGDDREDGDDDPGDEEWDPRPGREARLAAVQPQPAVEEEPDRDQSGADHEGLERPGTPEILGREHGTHGRRLARSAQARARTARAAARPERTAPSMCMWPTPARSVQAQCTGPTGRVRSGP